MIDHAELDLAAMTRDEHDWKAAADMATADTTEDAPEDMRFCRGVVIGLLCAAPIWAAIATALVVWRMS